jgi:hypothetical protein
MRRKEAVMDADKAWFRPKRYGMGATPRTWQGWLATFLFALVEIGILRLLAPRGNPVIVMLAAFAVLAAFLLLIALTSGPDVWKWHWGRDR